MTNHSFTEQSYTADSFNNGNIGGIGHYTDAIRKIIGAIKSFNSDAKLILEKTRTHVTNVFLRKAFDILDNSYAFQSFSKNSFTHDDVPSPVVLYSFRQYSEPSQYGGGTPIHGTVFNVTKSFRVKSFLNKFSSHTGGLSGTVRAGVWTNAVGTNVTNVVYSNETYNASDIVNIETLYTFPDHTVPVDANTVIGLHFSDGTNLQLWVDYDNDNGKVKNGTNWITVKALDGEIIIEGSLPKHTTDSHLKIKDIQTQHLSDARIVVFDSLYHDTDSVLKIQENSYNLSSFTEGSFTTIQLEFRGHTTDSNLHKPLTHQTHSFLAYPVEKQHTTDVYLRRGYWVRSDSYTFGSFRPESYTTDHAGGINHATDIHKKKLGEIKSHTTNSYLVFVRKHTTDSQLFKGVSPLIHSFTKSSYTGISYDIDVIRIVGHYTDKWLKKLDDTKVFDTDSYLKIPNSEFHTTDSRLYKPSSPFPYSYTDVSYTITSYTVNVSPYTPHSTDSYLKQIDDNRNHFTNSHIVHAVSHGTNSELYVPLSPLPWSYNSSSFVEGSYTTQAIKTIGHYTDSFFNSIRKKSHTTSSKINRIYVTGHATNSYIQREYSVLGESFTNVSYTNTSYTVFRFSYTRDSYTDTSYRVDTPIIPRHLTDSYLKKIGYERIFTTDSNLARPKTHQTHSLLYKVQDVFPYSYTNTSYTDTSYTVDTNIYTPHYTDSLLKSTKAVSSHSTDSYFKVPNESSHSTDAQIKIQEWSYNSASYTDVSYRAKLLVFLGQPTDSFLKIVGKELTSTSDSHLKVPVSKTHTTDARLYKPFDSLPYSYSDVSYTSTSYTVEPLPATTNYTDAYLKKLGDTKVFTTDSYIVFLKSHSTDSSLYAVLPISVNSYTSASYTDISYTTDILRIIGHATDSFIKKLGEIKSHITDSYLKVPRTKSHTTDSRLYKPVDVLPYSYSDVSYTNTSYTVEPLPSTTHYSDAYLYKLGDTKSHATDSYIVRSTSHVTDAFLRVTYSVLPHSYKSTSYTPESYTVNFIITIAHGTDSSIILGMMHSTNSVLKRLDVIKSHSTDSFIKKLDELKSHTTDSLTQVVDIVLLHQTDSALKRIDDTKIYTTDALKKVVDIIVDHTTDALKKVLGVSYQHSTDSSLKKLDEIKTHTTDSFKKVLDVFVDHITDSLVKFVGAIKIHSTDSSLKRIDDTKVHSTDSLKKVLGVILTHETDSTLQLEIQKQHVTDSLLKKLDITKVHTTDSLKKVVDITTSHSTESSIKFASTLPHSTDSFIKIIDKIKTFTTDSRLKKIDDTKIHTTDSYLRYLVSVTHVTDSFKKIIDKITSHITDSVLKFTYELTSTSDSFVKVKDITTSHQTDSSLKKIGDTKSHSTDSRLSNPLVHEYDTDSYLIKFGETKIHTTSSALEKQNIQIHITSSSLQGAVIREQTTDSYLEFENIRVKGTSVINPIISGVSVITEIVKGTSVIIDTIKGTSVITDTIKGTSVINEEVDGDTSI